MLTPIARQRGITLIEILIVVTIIAVLTLIAVPNFAVQLRNAQIRTAAEQLQNDLRLAQAQAIATNRQVEFVMSTAMSTAAAPQPAASASATASYWYAATVPLYAGDPMSLTQVAAGSTGGAGAASTQVTVTAPTNANTLCFSPSGRLTAISSSTATITCSVPTGNPAAFQVRSNTSPATFVQLNVTLSAAGQVRLCNATKSLASYPDGC
jgi:type IV fimbrial biogenesis protein FimT